MKSTVIIEGIPGAGKTTVTQELASILGPQTLHILEPDEKHNANPYLLDYYAAPKKWAFTMQVHLLQARYRAHQRIMWYAMANIGHGIMDRSFYGDVCFAHLQRVLGFMSEQEFATYRDLFHGMTATVHYPAVCIFLRVQPSVALQRIQTRMESEEGRKCETAITLDYLTQLDVAVQHMVSCLRLKGTRVLEVDWDGDRSTIDLRKSTLEVLAADICEASPSREFADIFSRVT